jgi:integrase
LAGPQVLRPSRRHRSGRGSRRWQRQGRRPWRWFVWGSHLDLVRLWDPRARHPRHGDSRARLRVALPGAAGPRLPTRTRPSGPWSPSGCSCGSPSSAADRGRRRRDPRVAQDLAAAADRVQQTAGPEVARRPVSREEPFYLRDRAMLELLYATGMRASEAAGLRTTDLNLDIGYLRCFGKGNKERVIPVGRMAIAATREYLRDLRPRLARPQSQSFVLFSRTGRPAVTYRDLATCEEVRRAGGHATQRDGPYPASLLCHPPAQRRGRPSECAGDAGPCRYRDHQIYTHVDHERLRQIHKQFHPRP